MFGLQEWILLILLLVLLFGPQMIINTAKSLGQGVSEFKKAVVDNDDSGSESKGTEVAQNTK